MVAGGTEACINSVAVGGFARMRALSTKVIIFLNMSTHGTNSPLYDVDLLLSLMMNRVARRGHLIRDAMDS